MLPITTTFHSVKRPVVAPGFLGREVREACGESLHEKRQWGLASYVSLSKSGNISFSEDTPATMTRENAFLTGHLFPKHSL